MAPPKPSSFEQALRRSAHSVEAAMDAAMPINLASRLQTAMRYALMGQGKRLRPFFVLESCKLYGVDERTAMAVATALESIHCYSLVHDDLPAMDDDELRRGQPTVHKKFDEATAILAGDGLLTFAFELAAPAGTHIIAALARAAGPAGMVGGQMLDIEAETRGFNTYADVAQMQRLKTGALFEFACTAGPIIKNEDVSALKAYAQNIGLAFQIADDILDVEATATILGKATQKDKGKGKATFVDLLGLELAKKEALRLADAAVDALSSYDAKADLLREAALFIVKRQK